MIFSFRTSPSGSQARARVPEHLSPPISPALSQLRNLLEQRTACDEILAFADRRRWWLWGAVLLIYILAFNGLWRIQPDSALYLSIGRNLAEGKGFTYQGVPNHLAYPGWPAVIALTFKLCGSDSLLAAHAVMVGFSLLTVALTYRLMLLHKDRPTAVVVSVGLAVTKTFFLYGFELWSDLPFTLGVAAFLAGYEGVSPGIVRKSRGEMPAKWNRGRWFDWALLVGGLIWAATMRPAVWPMFGAIAIVILVDLFRGRIRRGMLVGIGFAVAVLAGLICINPRRYAQQFLTGDYEHYLVAHLSGSGAARLMNTIGENLKSLLNWAASDVLFQVRFGPYVNALLGLFVIGLGVSLFRNRLLWGLWFCLLLATNLLAQEMLDRYFLPVLPLLVFAWWEFLVRVNRSPSRAWGNIAFWILFGFGGISNFSKVGGIIVQQRSKPFLTWYDHGTYQTVPELAKLMSARLPTDAVVVAKKPYGRVLEFLSRREVISPVLLPNIRLNGRPLYVVEPGDAQLSAALVSIHRIETGIVARVLPSAKHDFDATPLTVRATESR